MIHLIHFLNKNCLFVNFMDIILTFDGNLTNISTAESRNLWERFSRLSEFDQLQDIRNWLSHKDLFRSVFTFKLFFKAVYTHYILDSFSIYKVYKNLLFALHTKTLQVIQPLKFYLLSKRIICIIKKRLKYLFLLLEPHLNFLHAKCFYLRSYLWPLVV